MGIKKLWTLTCALVLLLSVSFVFDANAQIGNDQQTQSTKIKKCDFKMTMRGLWDDHVAWTRLFIVSASADLPDTAATTQRLLRNQTDIGNAVKPFYGDAAGDKLAELLKEHIIIAAQILAAAKAGESEEVRIQSERWIVNADEISEFLHKANPRYWELDHVKRHMRDHLTITTQEVVAHLTGDWDADIKAYDKARKEILHMADMFSDGIIKQFPQRFRN